MIRMTLRRFTVGVLLLIAALLVPWLLITSQKPTSFAIDAHGKVIKYPYPIPEIDP